MKTKRFLSLVLSLVLTLSLAAPALAAEPGEESGLLDRYSFQEQYLAGHPQLKADFDAGAWFADNYSYWTKEEYMEALEVDEAEFEERMWNEYCWSAENGLYIVITNAYEAYQVDYYDETHPGELDKLDTRALLEKAGYYDMTAETWYMQNNGLTTLEEVRTSLLSDYVTARLTVEATHARFLEYQSAYPEKWAEFDAGAYFEEQYGSFMTKEGYMDGYYLFTEEELAEKMFSEYILWNRWTWDTGYDWPQKDQPITLVVNGETLYDAVITAGDGVTYADAATLNAVLGTSLEGEAVLIRSAAEAAGWDVTWNEMNNEVVLLDRESLLKGVLAPSDFREEWDSATDPEAQFVKNILGEPDEKGLFTQDFSRYDEMMNRTLEANKGKEGEVQRTTSTFDFTLTAFNSLDGDETYTVTVKADLLVKDQVADLTLTADLAQLWVLLPQSVKDKVAANLPKVTFQDLPALLGGCKLRLIYNMEEGVLYWNCPILALFDDSIEENTWGKVDFSSRVTVVTAEQETSDGWNTAEKLYNDLLADSAANWWGAEDAYSDFAISRVFTNLLVGNDRITRRGDTLTWSLDADALTSCMALEDGYVDLEDLTAAGLFKEFNVTFSVEKDGRYSLSAAIRPDMDAIAAQYTADPWYDTSEAALMTWVMNLLDFRMSADVSGMADRTSGNAQFHWKNQFKLELKTSSQRRTNAGDPLSAPPAGAEVVELY
ncbi:MAG: hypothetical protein HFF04_00140 [Oscillospiraceae bacterium]|nr:hypothetical protein [Oscillospiraceae bacterium]